MSTRESSTRQPTARRRRSGPPPREPSVVVGVRRTVTPSAADRALRPLGTAAQSSWMLGRKMGSARFGLSVSRSTLWVFCHEIGTLSGGRSGHAQGQTRVFVNGPTGAVSRLEDCRDWTCPAITLKRPGHRALERDEPRPYRSMPLRRARLRFERWMTSNSSRLRPEPTATQVSGLSARCTGICVSCRTRSSRP